MARAEQRFRAHIVSAVLAYVRERGRDPNALVRRCALPTDAETAPHVELPLDELCVFWREAERESGDTALGIRVAQRLSRSTWDVLQLSCLSSATLEQGLARVVRLIVLLNDSIVFRMTRDAQGVSIEQTIAGHPEGMSRHGNEHWVVALLERARQTTGVAIVPSACWFGHTRPGDAEPLFEALGTREVHFGAGSTGLRFAHEDAARPLRSSDPVLLSVLDRLSATALSNAHGHRGTAAQVCRALESLLEGEVPEIARVARSLRTSVRSLQRSLGDEGTSYRALVEQVRRDKARALLAKGVAIEDISQRLGYSERSAFVRAFTRWSGSRAPRDA